MNTKGVEIKINRKQNSTCLVSSERKLCEHMRLPSPKLFVYTTFLAKENFTHVIQKIKFIQVVRKQDQLQDANKTSFTV